MNKKIAFTMVLIVVVLAWVFAGCSSTSYRSKYPGDYPEEEGGARINERGATAVIIESKDEGSAPYTIKYWVWIDPDALTGRDGSRAYPDKIEVLFGDYVEDVTEDALKFLKSPGYDEIYGTKNFDESLLLSYTFETPGVFGIISRCYYGEEYFETLIGGVKTVLVK